MDNVIIPMPSVDTLKKLLAYIGEGQNTLYTLTQNRSRNTTIKYLKYAKDKGFIEVKVIGPRRSKQYRLTDRGKGFLNLMK